MYIHAIQTGRVQVKQAQIIGRGHGLARRLAPLLDDAWSVWLPTYAFAIEHAEGVIVVDSGANAGLMQLPRWHPYFRFAVRFAVEREEELGPRLAAIGIGPRDVKTVVLTHLHIDHDGGLKDLPFSRALVNSGELDAASGFAGQMRGYLPRRWPKAFDPTPLRFEDAPFGPFSRACKLTADGAVIAFPTPGHTPHHISVAVEDQGTTFVLAGDASYTEANMLAGHVDGVSENERDAKETLWAMRELASQRPVVYLPTHDRDVAERLRRRKTVFVAPAAKSQPLLHPRAAE